MNEVMGVRAHDLSSKGSKEMLVKALKDYGFHKIQLVFPKALSPYSYEKEFVQGVSDLLRQNDIQVTMLGAYFNPVHSHRDVVEAGIANFRHNLEISHLFDGVPYVGSETGSYHDSPWLYEPKNQTEEGYQETKKVFEGLLSYAESIGSKVIIESAWNHVIYSYQQHARLLQELNSDSVFATIDLFNLLYEGNFDQRDEIFEGALRTLGNKIKVLHIKDAKMVDGKLVQCAPGTGEFHYDHMVSCMRKYCPEAQMVFEGVTASEMPIAKKTLDLAIKG